jgi:hypothetical protein
MDVTVFFGFVIAWRFAGSPTLRSPFPLSRKATILGVVLRPSLLAITTGSLPSITATQEFVVPKSIPIIFPMTMFIYKIVILPLFISGKGITMPMPVVKSRKKVTQCQKLWWV